MSEDKTGGYVPEPGDTDADRLTAALAEIERLRAGISAYLTGDYPNPRDHRPGNCPHGHPYYEECMRCDSEHFERLLARD